MTKQAYIVIELIRMDLYNHKFVNSLHAIHIDAEVYCLGIDEPIFELMGLQERPDVDDIFEQYYEKSRAILTINLVQERHRAQLLAMELYEFLLQADR